MKTYVVTGVTSGIGLALARAIAHTALRLVIVGRNDARLQAAVDAIGRRQRNLELIPILADLGTLAGTRSLAKAPSGNYGTGWVWKPDGNGA